jgi:subtilisin-like proprotein convertase family protein
LLPPYRTIISEIEVTDDYLIGDLDVQLSITHTHISWLDGYLTGPDGQRIELFEGVGAHDDHFEQTVFDDQSRYPITKARPPFKGSFMPAARVKQRPSLSHFNGKSVKGVWQLVIRGTRNERFGMLHSWGLIVKPLDNMLENRSTESTDESNGSGESSTTENQTGEGQRSIDESSFTGDGGTRQSTSNGRTATIDPRLKLFGAQLIKRSDRNGDGVLTIDEYSESDRAKFSTTDTNGDGKVDVAEMAAAIMSYRNSQNRAGD